MEDELWEYKLSLGGWSQDRWGSSPPPFNLDDEPAPDTLEQPQTDHWEAAPSDDGDVKELEQLDVLPPEPEREPSTRRAAIRSATVNSG